MNYGDAEWRKAQKSLLEQMQEALEKVGCKSYKDRFFLDWAEFNKMIHEMTKVGFQVQSSRVAYNGVRTVLVFGENHVFRSTSLRWFPDEEFKKEAITEVEEYIGSVSAT